MRTQRILFFVCILFLAGFVLVAVLRDSFSMNDLQANLWAATIQTERFTIVAVAIAYVFDTPSLVAFSLIFALYLFLKNYKSYSVLLLTGMSGDALLVAFTKTLIQSPRPLNGLVSDSGFSFPSGHTAGSIVFCGLLVFFAWNNWNSIKAKTTSAALVVTIASIVAFDRVYLNVHWFSDVLGGCLLGLFWFTFILGIFNYVKTRRIQTSNLEQDKTAGPQFLPCQKEFM